MVDVAVVRSGARLLSDVTWSVGPDERWVILGPNGAGKSTLLSLAAARIHPSEGYAAVLGEILGTVDVFDLRPRVGLTSSVLADQIPAAERVRDLVLTSSYAVLGRWQEDYDGYDVQRADLLLGELGIEHLADRQFGTLSEGERKRAQIARALMTDPELLLLDEPAAGLDLGGREALLRTLSRMLADPDAPAMIMVTHHVEEIPLGITHALLLREGSVLTAGPVGEAITASTLSECFDMPLRLRYSQGRFTAVASPEE